MFDTNKPGQSVKFTGYLLLYMIVFCQVNANAETLVDPTMPPGIEFTQHRAGIKTAPKWVLTSTLIASTRRVATINGKTVSVGDRIGGARVIQIEPSQVALRQGTRHIVVKLSPRDFKRTVRK